MAENKENSVENFNLNTRILEPDAYTASEDAAISLISFKKYDDSLEPPEPFGSASYVIQKYPGDLDLMEKLICEGPPSTCVEHLSKIMRKMVLKIISRDCHWVTDIKAGVDARYDIDIGILRAGKWNINRDGLMKMVRKIDIGDARKIDEIMHSQLSESSKYDSVVKILREYKIIRWTPDEILAGLKTKNGLKITLEEALNMASQCKIDMVSKIDGRYIETTNMLYIGSYVVENGQKQLYIINSDYDFNDYGAVMKKYELNMQEEIEKLFYSSIWRNPFKGAKRMWAYSRVLGDINTNNALTPIVTGDISALYQIKSEISTILLVLDLIYRIYSEKSADCILRDLHSRCQQWKKTIAHCVILSDNEMKELFVLCDAKKLDILEDTLHSIVSKLTMNTLTRAGLYPVQAKYLPTPRRYL